MKWQIESPGKFYDRNEKSVVYFDPQSCDTHLVSEFAGQIIQHLAGKTLGLNEIINMLSPDISPVDLPELTRAVPDILLDLVALDIVEQV